MCGNCIVVVGRGVFDGSGSKRGVHGKEKRVDNIPPNRERTEESEECDGQSRSRNETNTRELRILGVIRREEL